MAALARSWAEHWVRRDRPWLCGRPRAPFCGASGEAQRKDAVMKHRLSALVTLAVAGASLIAFAQAGAAREVDNLDRGVVAVTMSGGDVYIGWRLLASDPCDVGFNVLRSGASDGRREKLNATPVIDSCNFVDTTADGKAWSYVVQPVSAAVALAESEPVRSDMTSSKSRPDNSFSRFKRAFSILV